MLIGTGSFVGLSFIILRVNKLPLILVRVLVVMVFAGSCSHGIFFCFAGMRPM